MFDFSKKSQTIAYFNSIFSELTKSKVKAIFSLAAPFWTHDRGHRSYWVDTELYVMLENGMCLVITYHFIDELEIQLRRLTPEEEKVYTDAPIKDFLNSVNHIHDSPFTKKVIQIETCTLEYSYINSVSLRSVTEKYGKWLNGGIDYVSPTPETFDEIKFTMSNGKSFIICAGDAEIDGYALLWSDDAEETITHIT